MKHHDGNRRSCIISCFLMSLLLFSCIEENEETIDLGSLNDSGKFFVAKLKERQGWEKEWQTMRKLGELHLAN
jgi:hypothetical protein